MMVAKTVKNLYGLVLIGGQSKRMHRNKANLKYHGQEQWRSVYELLAPVCEKVFLSLREKRAGKYKPYLQIPDAKNFSDLGPLGGMLSAMRKYPQRAWIVLACDLPFVTEKTLQVLLKKRDPQKYATAFRSAHDKLPEPLCAIYEPRARVQMLKFLKKDIRCPRKIMIHSNAKLLKLNDKKELDNINNPVEYRHALQILKHG